MKKVRKLVNRKEHALAIELFDRRPQYNLNHLVKERYPTFQSALRDLSDGLNLMHLFSVLPSLGPIRSEKTESCNDFCRKWKSYIETTFSLTKAFISVKGIYFQANVQGESVTWLRPHVFSQNLPENVDFRVMLTFLEFFETFLGSVLFRLSKVKTEASKSVSNALGSSSTQNANGFLMDYLSKLAVKFPLTLWNFV